MMIVEDEWLFASDLQEQLTALRYEVVALMASGEEALSKVESAHPDVAIMDVALAGIMKGTETASSAPAQKLRCAKNSGTPRSFRTSARVWLPENRYHLRDILTAVIEITRSKAGTVQMLDDEDEELVVLATRGFSQTTKKYFQRDDASSNTSCGLALRTGTRSYFSAVTSLGNQRD